MIGERYVAYHDGKESYRGVLINISDKAATILKDDGWLMVDYIMALRLEYKVDQEQRIKEISKDGEK